MNHLDSDIFDHIRAIQRQEEKKEAIERRAEDLMADDAGYNPLTAQNLCDASIDLTHDDFKKMETFAKAGDLASAFNVLVIISERNCRQMAESAVADDLKNDWSRSFKGE